MENEDGSSLDHRHHPDPMKEIVWSLLHVLIWIRYRTPEKMLHKASRSVFEAVIDDTLGNHQVATDLRNKLFLSELQAYGYRMLPKELGLKYEPGRDDDLHDKAVIREAIPAIAWLDADISEYWGPPPSYKTLFFGLQVRLTGQGNRTAWKSVIIPRTDVMKAFPSLQNRHPTENFTGEQQANTKRIVVGGSETHLDDVTDNIYQQLVENDIPQRNDAADQGDQQNKPAPTAQNVEIWFRDDWKPSCEARNIVPARDNSQSPRQKINDLDAAKAFFGCSVNREFVRAARNKIAPEWTKGGRRSTKG